MTGSSEHLGQGLKDDIVKKAWVGSGELWLRRKATWSRVGRDILPDVKAVS